MSRGKGPGGTGGSVGGLLSRRPVSANPHEAGGQRAPEKQLDGVGVGGTCYQGAPVTPDKAPQWLEGPQYWILTVGEGDTRAGHFGAPIVNLQGQLSRNRLGASDTLKLGPKLCPEGVRAGSVSAPPGDHPSPRPVGLPGATSSRMDTGSWPEGPHPVPRTRGDQYLATRG